MTDEEVAAVQAAAESINVDILNTRLVFFCFSFLWTTRYGVPFYQSAQEWTQRLHVAGGVGQYPSTNQP